MFCSQCGKPIPDDAMYCSECGAPTRNLRGQQGNGSPRKAIPADFYRDPVEEKFSGGIKNGIIVAAAAIGIAALILLLYTFLLKPQTPQDTVKRLEEAVGKLDVEGILECFDEENREQYREEMHSEAAGILGVAGSLGIGPDVTFKVTDTRYDENNGCTVRMIYRISFMDNEDSGNMTLHMVKDGKNWFIDSGEAGQILEELI